MNLHGKLNFDLMRELVQESNEVLLLPTVIVVNGLDTLVIQLELNPILGLDGVQSRDLLLQLRFTRVIV
jgi:hypothetical protein